MFKVEWGKKTGGIRLNSLNTKHSLGVSPRPVFFEELDLLKLNELGWTYPKCKEPLLWACNKQYFYRGELAFEAKGANIYDAATIIFATGKEKLTLEPVDVTAMLEQCSNEMFLLESEAIEFIRDVYVQYSSARKSVENTKANQLDFEALVAKLEKSTRQKMAIVKQDCDSFDIMPLENAKQEGKRTYTHTTTAADQCAGFAFARQQLYGNAQHRYTIATLKAVGGNDTYHYTAFAPTSLDQADTNAPRIYAHDGRIYTDAPMRIYTLTGLDVTSLNGSLKGIYIVKTATNASKIIVR